jgi:hypothetical protein
VIGWHLPSGRITSAEAAEAGSPFEGYIRISPENKVTVLAAHLDMGQGIYTGTATLVAEELESDWSQMEVEGGYGNPALYGNLAFGGKFQGTGGSTATMSSFDRYRRAGAMARAMLVSAGVSIAAFFGLLGSTIQPYSPLVAIGLALILPPIFAIATKGRYYLRRVDDGIDLPMDDELGNPSDAVLVCHVCRQEYERPDMVGCETHDSVICSLCLSTDRLKDHVLPPEPKTAATGEDVPAVV